MKTYQKYIVKSYLETILNVSLVFLCLIFIMNIFEEINYLKDSNINVFYPLFLTVLNSPSILFTVFPFIFLIATKLFFLKINDKNELVILKNFGVDNFKIFKIITLTSLLTGIIIITLFYNFSASLKHLYLDLKNNFSKDNKYLAVITENGLWIRDEIDNKINLINASKINKQFLENVSIVQFSKDNFDFVKNIDAKKADIKNNRWILNNAKVSMENNIQKIEQKITFQTNFNSEKINSLFSNLSSLSFIGLNNLKNDYEQVGYSTKEIEIHFQKIFSYPFFLTVMSLFAGIIMININFNKPKIFYLILGILLSVIIYFFNYFFYSLAQTDKMPIVISIWSPISVLFIGSFIGIIRSNEK